MKNLKTILGAASLAILSATPVVAAERVLTIASWAPPTHVVNAKMWPLMVERLEEISGGALTAKVKLNLAPPPAMSDLVLDGAADITFIFHGYNAGRFVTNELVELPGTSGSAEATSAAYWRAWDKHLRSAGEQDEFKTLAMFMHGPAHFHLTKTPSGLESIKGMKLRAPGGVGSAVIKRLGAIGIQVPATKVYETLSSGAADGVIMNIDSRTGFKLDEVAPVFYEVEGGIFRGSFTALMSRETWDSLDADVQSRLDAEFFGEPMSRAFGRLWDESDAATISATQKAENPMIKLSDADTVTFTSVAKQVEAEVVKKVSAKGIDAQAVLDAFRADSLAIQAEIEK